MSLNVGVFPISNAPEIVLKIVHARRMETLMKLEQLTTIGSPSILGGHSGALLLCEQHKTGRPSMETKNRAQLSLPVTWQDR